MAGSARAAGAAADLKRNHDPVSGANLHHVFADRQHLGNAFMAEVERQREWSSPEQEETVEVARRNRDGMHDGAVWTGQSWHRGLPPLHPASRADG
jgi:hypothetical protein